MKSLVTIISIGLFMAACQPPVDNSANEAFEKNSATVLKYLQEWEKESLDYDDYFATDAWLAPTEVGSKDSISRAEMISKDKEAFENLDFSIPQDIEFLPGVNNMTKEMDGSVRYYGVWTITLPASENNEAISVDVKVYESYDFDEEGKILVMQSYGDWGGVRDAMEDAMEGEDMDDEDIDEDLEEEEME